MVDKKVKKKIERKINKLLKIMIDDDSENKHILTYELILFHDKYNFSRHDFVDILLSTKVSIEQETLVDKIIEWMYHSESACVILKNEKGNIPIQTAIETGYSTDFICQYIKKYFDWHYLAGVFGADAGNVEGDTILHTLLKNCEKNEYDVFRIFRVIKSSLPYTKLELIENNNSETIINLINQILSKEDENVIELASTYKLRKNLRNTKAYFYNLHFDKFLEQIDEENFVLKNREFIEKNMVFYDELVNNYTEFGLEPVKGLLNLCTKESYDQSYIYHKICSLIKTGYVELNYIDNNGDDFISLALKSGYSIDFIKKLFSIAFPLVNYSYKDYINLLRICLTKRHDIDSYLFYKFLSSDGFNLLSGTEPIFSNEINTINNYEYMFGVSQHWVFERDYTASFIKKLTYYLVDDYGLFLRVKNIETCLDMYTSINAFEANIKNKLSGNINDIDLAKMVANIIYENRINSIKENNYDDVTINEVINAIDLLTLKIDDNDFYNILAFKSKSDDNILVFKSKNEDKVLEKNI